MDKNSDDVNNGIAFQYRFIFGGGLERKIDIKLDKKTLNLIQTKRESYPEWTELKYFKCPNCPLDEEQHSFCPVAVNLVDLIDFFQDMISYKEVDLLVQSEERTYIKHTTLQQGISSLMGIYMVTSGCPIMEKLKPMVCYHLPFPTLKETQYRVISMYLLAQYFLHKRGKEPDWELKNLVKVYDDIRIVNKGFFQRLAQIKIRDATLNALIKLDMFAQHISFSIDRNVLDEMEYLFYSYFQ
jgi:hypothetical protein